MNLTVEEKRLLRSLIIPEDSMYDVDAFTCIRGMTDSYDDCLNMAKRLEEAGLLQAKYEDSFRLSPKGAKALRYGKYSPRQWDDKTTRREARRLAAQIIRRAMSEGIASVAPSAVDAEALNTELRRIAFMVANPGISADVLKMYKGDGT